MTLTIEEAEDMIAQQRKTIASQAQQIQDLRRAYDEMCPRPKADPIAEAHLEMMDHAHQMHRPDQYTRSWMKWMALRVNALEKK